MVKKKTVKSAAKPARKAKTAKCSVKRATKKAAPKAIARRAPKKLTTKKAAVSKRTAPVKQGKGFAGASEVSVTDNKIIVTREVSENRRGRYKRKEERVYLDKTPSNMAALDRKLKGTAAKKVTVKFKQS